MMAAGALDEVRALAARKLDPSLPAMKAHGVPWLIRHLNGEIALAEAVEHAKLRHAPIHQAAGDVVPQSVAGIRMGRADRRTSRDRAATASIPRHVMSKNSPASTSGVPLIQTFDRATDISAKGQKQARAPHQTSRSKWYRANYCSYERNLSANWVSLRCHGVQKLPG